MRLTHSMAPDACRSASGKARSSSSAAMVPSAATRVPSAIIFCNTKDRVHYVSVVLQRFGYDADELSADLSQAERERVLDRVRKGTLRFLVATDVAARGLDIPLLSHVISMSRRKITKPTSTAPGGPGAPGPAAWRFP